MHELTQYDFELPGIDEHLAGDSRTLAFQVVGANGDGVDISGATPEWRLFDRAYQTGDANAVLTGSDAGVEIVTDSRVDSATGEWEVRLSESATTDLYGEYYHRPVVVQSDGSRASWRGEFVVTA